MSGAIRKRAGGGRDAHPIDATVSAVIVMRPGDTSLSNALATCIAARVHVIYIVDAIRGENIYVDEPLIVTARSKGARVVFVACDGDNENDLYDNVYSKMGNDYMFLSIPPDFHATGEQTRALIKRTRESRQQCKRFAVAPTYANHPGHTFSPWDGLTLMLHVFWSLVSLLYRGRLYRGTYLQSVILSREMDSVALPEVRFGFAERAPFIYGGRGGARSRPPIDRAPMDNFLYTVSNEPFNIRIWLALLVYMALFTAPYHAVIRNGFLATARTIIIGQTMFIVQVVFHLLLTLFFANKYFGSMRQSFVHALLAPFLMPLFVLLVVYAKTLWCGYSGDLPTLRFPDITTVPLFTDYMNMHQASAPPLESISDPSSSSSSSLSLRRPDSNVNTHNDIGKDDAGGGVVVDDDDDDDAE